MKKINWRLIEGLIKTDLAILGIFAFAMIYINWAMSLPGPWTAVVIFLTVFGLANVATYFAMEADRKHIAACKKKGIKPTLLHPWGGPG